MTFEDTLAAVASFVGDRVDVTIESPASGLIAHFSGALMHAHELSAREVDHAPLFFSFADGGSGFVLSADAFAGAERSPDGSLVRIQDRAGVGIIVERAAAQTERI